jgi:hypothetical protein
MYTLIVADLYSEEWLAVSLYFRSAHDPFSQISHALADKRCRLVFVVVAFPPPLAYAASNEARSPKTASDFWLPSRLIISTKARLRFYPRRLGKSCDLPTAQAFRLQRGV